MLSCNIRGARGTQSKPEQCVASFTMRSYRCR